MRTRSQTRKIRQARKLAAAERALRLATDSDEEYIPSTADMIAEADVEDSDGDWVYSDEEIKLRGRRIFAREAADAEFMRENLHLGEEKFERDGKSGDESESSNPPDSSSTGSDYSDTVRRPTKSNYIGQQVLNEHAKWGSYYRAVMDFVKINKELPSRHIMHEGLDIGNWCLAQSVSRTSMGCEKRLKLARIRHWKFVTNNRKIFRVKYSVLRDCVISTGKSPSDFNVECHMKLGNFVKHWHQREYDLRCEQLDIDPEYRRLFDSLPGWVWRQ